MRTSSASPREIVVRVALVILLTVVPTVAAACPVCYGQPSSSAAAANGANNAVLFLLAIVVVVQIAFVALFISFWKRSRSLQKRREEMRVIPGGLFGTPGR